MTIDKQALLGADKHANQHRLSRLIIEANSAELRAIAEAVEQYTDQLIAALEAAEKRIAEQSAIVAAAEKLVRCKGRYHSELNYRALAKLFGVITPDLPPLEHENVHYADADEVEITALRQRIAELERSETQLINERDSAESALNDAYKAVMGQAPEWSNWFSFESAIDEIELACELWRNQTDDVIQFRQRIQELEAKLETADKLQDSAFRDGLKAGFSYGQTDDQSGFTQCMSAYSTRAGIKVIRAGFKEAFRVLRPHGVLVFKWNETQIPISQILALTDVKPLIDQRTGKNDKTHWIIFLKG